MDSKYLLAENGFYRCSGIYKCLEDRIRNMHQPTKVIDGCVWRTLVVVSAS